MPQLDFSTYLTQFFWVIVTFICFWFIMDKFIVPKLRDTIEERKRKYEDLILKADKINKKALESLKKYDEIITAAKIKANEQIKQNELELKKIIEEKELEIDLKLKEKIEQSEELLENESKNTIAKIDELSKDIALSIINQLDIKNITIKDLETSSKKE